MSNKKVLQEIFEKLSMFRLSDPATLILPDDLVILIPETDYNTFLCGYADYIDITGAEITCYGIKCRKSKENNIIVGVE